MSLIIAILINSKSHFIAYKYFKFLFFIVHIYKIQPTEHKTCILSKPHFTVTHDVVNWQKVNKQKFNIAVQHI